MRTLRSITVIAAVCWLTLPAGATAQQIVLQPVASGLTSPLFVGTCRRRPNRLFIVEREGLIKVLQPGASTPTVFLDIRTKVLAGGEQGLLGLAFHPRYASNGRFFVYYTRTGDGTLVIAEYRRVARRIRTWPARSRTVILTIPHPTNTNHNGGMLAFGRDGYLYIGVGDGGSARTIRRTTPRTGTCCSARSCASTSMRPDAPYASPIDNPFVGIGRRTRRDLRLRNAQPVALQLRPRHRPACGSATSARARAKRSTRRSSAAATTAGASSRAIRCTNTDPALCADPIALHLPDLRLRALGRTVLDHRRLRLPRLAGRGCRHGTYVYGDYCSGEIFGMERRHADDRAPRHDDEHLVVRRGRARRVVQYVDLNGTVSPDRADGTVARSACRHSR